MRYGVMSMLGATAMMLATTPLAQAAGGAAPPTLTPLVARDVAAACPGTAAYASALTSGIDESTAAAAAPVFDACAAGARRDVLVWRQNASSVAVGAVYLSLGLLRHDAAMLKRAVDATASLRSDVGADDQTIQAWSVIPDTYDSVHRRAIVRTDCALGTWAADAAYINVAAHTGTAWITAPRDAQPCSSPAVAYGRYEDTPARSSITGVQGAAPGQLRTPDTKAGTPLGPQ
jgi:hypothetical protein